MFDNLSISRLDLRNHQLTKIPTEVFKLKNLRKLDLRNNKIKSLPKEISRLTRLEVLDISYNNLQNLYAGLFKLKNLKVLILSYNKLKSIPKQIGQLKNLKILILASNSLGNLPDELKNLLLLQELDIAKNNFGEFPNVILNIPSLKSLWINNNNLITFPSKDLIKKLPKLKSLYCFGYPQVELNSKNADYLRLSKIRGNTLKTLLMVKKSSLPKKVSLTKKISVKPKLTSRIVEKTSIFISYSHNDKEWLDRVKKHLKVLNYENDRFEVWDDTMIGSGAKWKDEITKALNKCKIAILLISTDFLVSDFIRNDELPPLLKNAESKGTKILPLIILPSRFVKSKKLSVFQAVNDPQKPLSRLSLSEQEEILVKLTDEVERYLD